MPPAPRLRYESFILLLALIAFLLSTAAVVSSEASAASAEDWHLYVGDAVIDTVNGSVPEVSAAGRWVLARNAWTLERADPPAAKLITQWKPVRHPLVKLATGRARVRVAIALREIASGRTEVQVLGGIATESDLSDSPILPLAQSAGRHECQGFVRELKVRLADVRIAGRVPPGGLKTGSAAEQR